MNTLQVEFTKEKKYLTIYKKIKTLIIDGKIKMEEKIPSKRTLSHDLGVSLNTIMYAYHLLEEEGYIYAKEKSGYFVSSVFFHTSNSTIINYETKKNKEYRYDFTSSSVEEDTFPSFTFKKIVDDILTNDPTIVLKKAPYQGDIKLREAISTYLLENKAIEVSKEEIIIVSSLEESLNIVDSLINIKEMCIENPGFMTIRNYLNPRIKYDYLTLDEEGMTINSKRYDLAYVTPYNQFPTGLKMSLKRKNDLLNSKIKYIFEDDFDCDLINKTRYMSTLYTLDNTKVFYHGSFSHTLCPGLRISYLVIPHNLVKKYQEIYLHSSSKISSLDQGILEKFITEGYYYRHLSRIKKINVKKQEIIENILKTKDYISYSKEALTFIIDIKKDIDIDKIKKHLDDALIKIRTIDDFLVDKKSSSLILSYSSIQTKELEKGLNYLIETLEELF